MMNNVGYQLGGFAVMAPFTNFGGAGSVPVGSLPGVTPYGAEDMAGNVREWCWNETPRGRLIRGGAWEDNSYEFRNRRQAPAMDRSSRNGIRLAYYPDPEALPPAAFRFESLGDPRDFRGEQPVSDAIFQVYRAQFDYDDTDLNARVEYREESPGGWIREKVSFDAAYGGERVLAYLFLPANTVPPYQAVIYFPGVASSWLSSSEDLESYYEFSMFLSFLVRNGRAVLYPVYKGTFDRVFPGQPGMSETHQYTEYLVTRVRTPTLLLNGRYDSYFPPETSAQPMIDLLGTPPEHKRLILYETDHIPPRVEYVKETLAWLDRYLGPVGR